MCEQTLTRSSDRTWKKGGGANGFKVKGERWAKQWMKDKLLGGGIWCRDVFTKCDIGEVRMIQKIPGI